MRIGLERKIKLQWEPGKRLEYRPLKKKIKGRICISKKGVLYRAYYVVKRPWSKVWISGPYE